MSNHPGITNMDEHLRATPVEGFPAEEIRRLAEAVLAVGGDVCDRLAALVPVEPVDIRPADEPSGPSPFDTSPAPHQVVVRLFRNGFVLCEQHAVDNRVEVGYSAPGDAEWRAVAEVRPVPASYSRIDASRYPNIVPGSPGERLARLIEEAKDAVEQAEYEARMMPTGSDRVARAQTAMKLAILDCETALSALTED